MSQQQHKRPPRHPSHRVQFYAREAALFDQVARFLRAGLDAGEAGLVIATGAHNEALRARLAGHDVTYLDAAQALDSFLGRDGVDLARFDATVGEAVRQAARQGRHGRVRAFGEMVALLASQGRTETAVELERVWNGLAATVPLTLLCAYPLGAFPGPRDAGHMADVCAEHGEILPLAGEAGAPAAQRVAQLEQEILALRRELARQVGLGSVTPGDEDLRDFIDHAPVGMHKVGPDGIILWANRRELDLLGYEADAYVGRHVADFHADPAIPLHILDEVRAGRPVHDMRSRVRRHDGTFLHVLIDANGVFRDGRFVRTRCVIRPIAEQVAVETSLMQRERQQALVARIGHLALAATPLEAFFEQVCAELAPALEADTCGVLECLPASTDLQFRTGWGFPVGFAARVPGGAGSHSGYVLASGKPVVYADLAAESRFRPAPKLLELGVRSGMSVAVRTKDGVWGTLGVHTRTRREYGQDDVNFLEAVAHILGSAIDRRAAEEALQRNQERLEAVVGERTQRLEQANRELDAFSSAVSHDLRGPVRAIAGFSALLAQRHAGRLDPHGRELLEEVRRAAGRMGDLIEDLLDLSRADRALPNPVSVDLSTMAADILRAEAERSPSRHVHCDVDPDLVVHGDPDLLRMALENLLANAWKFTARTPEARISVSKRRQGEEVVLCVQDNGAGFDMADAGRLFQPFQRLHRRSEYEGTGIGLATVRRIIERHGGRIWVQAKPGAGAAFYFTLPGALQD